MYLPCTTKVLLFSRIVILNSEGIGVPAVTLMRLEFWLSQFLAGKPHPS